LTPRHADAGEVFNWKDVSPRLGAAYDLFGNAKTAIKWSLGRYVLQQGVNTLELVNPIVTTAATQTRTWNDVNRDFVVQGDPLNPDLNLELGPTNNRNFGKSVVNTRLDPAFARGYGVRPFNWELSVGVQHELLPRVSVNASYFRRAFGNFQITRNALVTPSDFTEYCVTAPTDSRLPGSGQRICSLFDVNVPGRLLSVITGSGTVGDQQSNWNGADFTTNVRLPNGVILQGGISTGKTMTDNCDILSKVGNATGNPSTRFCHVETPLLNNVKLLASYTFPWHLALSGAFQSNPPAQITSTFTAGNALIAPSLGRNLSAGSTATAAVELVAPGTLYNDRMYQFDVRLAKDFKVGPMQWQGLLDLYNAFNGNAVLSQNNNYGTSGTSWQVPLTILPGRLVKFGVQMKF
jgi:hypothetical protein